MKKIHLLIFLSLLCSVTSIRAQRTETKYYPKGTKAGLAMLAYSYGEYKSGKSSRIFIVDIPREDKYYFSALANMNRGEKYKIYIDEDPLDYIAADRSGWQFATIMNNFRYLTAGKHTITIYGVNAMVPMMEEIFLTTDAPAYPPLQVAAFLDQVGAMKQQSLVSSRDQQNQEDNIANKVLPNPEGTYVHAIDTSFAYSHYSVIYLGIGSYAFSTTGSTVAPTLMVFNTTNLNHSWSNAYGGGGNEASLNIYVSLAGYYSVMLRPSLNNTSGASNILYNGSTLVSSAVIAGKRFGLGGLKGGLINFFTCRLSASSDTRLVVSKYSGSSARAYNDDYVPNGGDWGWGVSSRIKRDFTGDEVEYVFLCAYSPITTGTCDVYMGNENSNVYATNYPEFPLLKADDAIKAAPSSGVYNCISWSGGITSSWSWPPSAYSTYNCSNTGFNYSDITCFDNFYANNPVRYPGAWNYTRTGATVSNATVDVWKLGITYTHGSVRKPGNNHPHGYDWESKPGGLTRTFHPRNALTNTSWGYGAVSDYYRSTGTFARTAGVTKAIESDADAVAAGLAVFENAKLSPTAQQKLSSLTMKTDRTIENRLNDLYKAWDATKTANAVYSDPAMYCKNPEFDALAAYAKLHPREAMIFTFDKFVNAADHMIGELMWTLTQKQYGHLLQEVKKERAEKPNDEQGRYKVHGDHDNGVLYVEKILKVLEVEQTIVMNDEIRILVSPNPVSDRLTIEFVTTKTSKISVNIISSQTGLTKTMQPETILTAGTHRFTTSIQGFAGNNGDIIAVQVMIDGVLKTVKVLVAK
ncbi:MAG TPA: hypothetical protein VGO58_09100 [Chitinophagaceae bacterium]|jgi:hypothetical protein|nr:hypothetical protein [Chitinophagaceae bacterium]